MLPGGEGESGNVQYSFYHADGKGRRRRYYSRTAGGADDYVLKPFTPGILKAKVSSLINGRQTLKQMYTKLFKLPGTDTIVVSEPEQAGEEVKTEDPFITAVIKIVEENICEADFSVKKLAAEMNMSQPTLYRKVKQSTDYTIIELIRGVRMRRGECC